MKNQFLVLLSIILMSTPSYAQLDLILHEVDPGYAANHIAEDNEGNTIVCGNTFIGKLGPDSTWQWTTSIMPAEGSPGVVFILDMTTDAGGNIFLTGRFSHSIQFGSIILTSLGNTEDLYVTKLDPDGNFLWAKSYGTSGGKDLGNGIALDAAGNIYITGSFFNKTCSGPNPSGLYIRDIYVAKLNSSGVAIWQKRFPPTKLQCPNGGGGSRVEVDGSGNVYATGAFNGTIKFGNTSALSLTSLGNGDVFTIKLNSSATALWAKAGRGTAAENSTSLYVDNAGNALVGGYFGAYNNGSVTFSPFTLADVDGNGTGSLGIVSNAFLVKYLADGAVAWAVNPGTMAGIHNTVNGIEGKTANEIYISLPSLGIKTISVLDGSQLSFIEMADNFSFLNGLITEKMLIRDMGPSTEGFLFSLRGICGSISMDNLTLSNEYCSDCSTAGSCGIGSHGDVFVIRSASGGAIASPPIASRGSTEIVDFDLFPNPATNELQILIPASAFGATIRLFDYLGRIRLIQEIEESKTHTSILLGDHFENGIFFIQVERLGETQAKQFIIVK